MDIGVVIKKYRKEAGMTQEETANRLGVTTPAVNKWENSNSKRILNCWHQLQDCLIFHLIHYFLFMKNFQILKSKKLSGRWTGCFQKKAMKRLMNGH